MDIGFKCLYIQSQDLAWAVKAGAFLVRKNAVRVLQNWAQVHVSNSMFSS